MNPRNGGNYTEPKVTRESWNGHETIEHVAYVGGEEIGRFETDVEAAAAVHEGMHLLDDDLIEIHTSNVQEVAAPV